MDPAIITPFLASLQNVFSTMLQLPVQVGEPAVKSGPAPTFDVSGIIGMSGDVTGNIVISFPKATAQRLVALFTGSDMPADHPDFADAIGELANMISGNAKGMFPGNKKVSISVPSVVLGEGHTIARPKDVPCIVIPANTDCGQMVLEIAIATKPAQTVAAPAATARA